MINQRWLAIIVLGIFLLSGCSKEEPKQSPIRPVKYYEISDAKHFSQRTFPGKARPTEEVELSFEVSGVLTQMNVKKGDKVNAKQLLAKLDQRDFINALEAAQAEMSRAQAHYERIQRAAKAGAVAQQQLTDAKAQFQVAEAQLKIKEKALENTQISAPFSGLIGATYVENFQNIRAKQPIIRLLDISKIEITVDIPETLIAYVPHTTKIEVKFDAFPERVFEAKIKEIGTEASEHTQTFPVTIIMEQPNDFTILPGMAAEVSGQSANSLPKLKSAEQLNFKIPLSAVFSDSSKQTYVWVINEENFTLSRLAIQKIKVTTDGLLVSGVKPGQKIVSAGVNYLSDGQTVRLLAQ